MVNNFNKSKMACTSVNGDRDRKIRKEVQVSIAKETTKI